MSAANQSALEASRTEAPSPRIISVYELLSDASLDIPLYQRPYKWTEKNIQQLFSDIAAHKGKSSYRLGTIVFHQDDGKKKIVDGQQRTITLLLTVKALIAHFEKDPDRVDMPNQLSELKRSTKDVGLSVVSFKSEISKANILNNYREISRIVSRPNFTEEHINFLLHKCTVVTFCLTNVSEAFQFFDSQNARGRDLEPHDLLKAYHLREFGEGDESLKVKTVAHWENSESSALADLFSQYLYRIRNWAKGESARYFGKDDTPLFKGVNLETVARYPYFEQLRISHHFVDQYNGHSARRIDGNFLAFPFHLDQIVINGRRFFEMTAKYQEMVVACNESVDAEVPLFDGKPLDELAAKIMKALNTYEGRSRKGDGYVRNVFDCLLIYYIDKFGYEEISRAIEKIFIWAYSLRLKMTAVHLASTDNYVLEKNMFRQLKDATHPSDFLDKSLPLLEKIDSSKTAEIEKLFTDMQYISRKVNHA